MYKRKKGTGSISGSQQTRNTAESSESSLPGTQAEPIENAPLTAIESSSRLMDAFEQDGSLIDEKEFRRALDRCYTQSQNLNICKLSLKKISARSAFEKLLEEELNVEFRMNNDNNEISVYLKNNFHDLVKELNAYCENDDKKANFFCLLEEEILDENKLKIYLSPAATEKQYVDTFIRALLLSNSSQAATFDLMLKKIETYAKCITDDEFIYNRLALACIAQFRYVDAIYDCKRVFNAIFECNLENWRSAPRDSLIQTIPEILTSPSVQQDAASNLQQMFLSEIRNESLAFRSTILETLSLLRTDEHTTTSIRGTLLQKLMKIEMELIPEIITYCLCSIQKSEKFAFRNTLYSLRAHLQIEKLCSRETGKTKKTVGQVLSELFEVILKKMKSGDGRYWKDAITVLTTEGQQQNIEESEIDQVECTEEFVPATKKELVLFDVLFCFALMDSENWDRLVYSFFKQQITNNRHFQLEKLVELAFQYTEFTSRFFRSILKFLENLMCSSMQIYIQFGAFGYKCLFIELQSKQELIFKYLLQHLNEIEYESTATLAVLQDLVENNGEAISGFFPVLNEKSSFLTYFSFDNVCRFFNILFSIERINEQSQITEQQQRLSTEIERMLSSSTRREVIWGILGMLMQLQQYLINNRMDNDDRENMIKEKLALLDERTKSDTYLRTCFYEYFARSLNNTTGIEYSTILISWTERLCLEFQSDYIKQLEKSDTHCRLEDERFMVSKYKEWFCLSEVIVNSSKDQLSTTVRIFEPIAHFQLLAALTKLKYSWSQEAAGNDFLKELLFVLKANISMAKLDLETTDEKYRVLNCDIFFFCIQWIRLLLNTFADSAKLAGSDADDIDDLLRKKFALMMDCQKSLKYTIEKIGKYRVPCMENFKQIEVIALCNNSKKKCDAKSKKKNVNSGREIDEEGDNNVNDDGDDTVVGVEQEINGAEGKENIDKRTVKTFKTDLVGRRIGKSNSGLSKLIDVGQLLSCFISINFEAIIRLIELLPKKRKQTTFLLEILNISLEQLLPKKEKKISSLMVAQESFMKEKIVADDNPNFIWRLIQSTIPTLFVILHGAVEYFKNLLDGSVVFDNLKRSYHSDMITLLHSSLTVFHNIFSSKDLMKATKTDATDEERSQRVRMKRRKVVMEKMERAMINAQAVRDTGGAEEAETVVSNYFISISEIVPTLDCAAALLQLLSCDFVGTSERAKVAKLALSYLKKEWTDAEENPLKGALLCRGVANILRLYLSFREPNDRFCAIQWILANKVSELVPEEERRRSKISSLEPCRDKDLDDNDESCRFFCINRATFASIYKVLFSSLNETVKNVLPVQAVEKGKLRCDDCFSLWKIAASSFCLLTLLIRVKELRNASVLLTAAREGRLFLQNFVIKSSFMFLLSGEARFAKYATGANAVFKTVQIGNRSLQNMSAHAKSTKSTSLLKLLPQLRIVSEQFIRAVHKLMIGVDCDDAFQIGLLKSRNLDGEELKETEVEEGFGTNHSEQRSADNSGNVDMENDEEQTDTEMDVDNESPIY